MSHDNTILAQTDTKCCQPMNEILSQIEGKIHSLTILQQFVLVEELENFWIQIHRETEEARKR